MEYDSDDTGIHLVAFNTGGWGVFDATHSIHVVPLDEVHLHMMRENGACMCKPKEIPSRPGIIPSWSHNEIEG